MSDLWNVGKIPYVGTSDLDQGLGYRYYCPDRVIAGKPMKDWLRFAVAYWHTFDARLVDPFGDGTAQRPYDQFTDPIQ